MASSTPQRIAAIVMLAAEYYLLGWLALLSAVPPSYAASVWPSAGIALVGLLHFGYRAWPGVALGSFLLSLQVTFGTTGDLVPAALTAAGIAAGATVQALAGAALVRRCSLGGEAAGVGRIAAMLALGGPFACLIGASAGIATLWATGVLARGDAGFNWFTWWVADAIGVLIGLPLYLLWTADPRSITPRSRMLATLPMLVLLAVISLLFTRTSALEREQAQAEFSRRSELIANNLEQKLTEYTEALHAVAGFLTLSEAPLDRDSFRRLVGDLLRRHPNLHAISWVPRITAAQRPDYEASMRMQGYAPAGIRVLGPQGALVLADWRAEYTPVTFMEPVRNSVLGFDLSSDPARLAALQQARDSGRATASVSIGLVDLASERSGVLILAPAYLAGEPLATVEERRAALRGYVCAALRVEQMLSGLLRGIDLTGIRIRLTDRGTPGGRLLVETPRPSAGASSSGYTELAAERVGMVHRVTMGVGGRPWEFTFTLDSNNPLPYRSPMAWSARVVALMFTGLLSTFLLVMVGRTVTIERQVRERTAELRDSNAALKGLNADLERSEQALRQSEEEARSVLETARDAYIAMDVKGTVVAWNREAEATFGWPREEAIGRNLPELLLPARPHRPRAGRLIRQLASGRTRFLNRRIETMVRHRDGQQLPVELTVWTTGHGQERRFHAFLHDISSRRAAMRRLAAQEAAAAALVASDNLAEAGPKVLQAICEAIGWCVGAIWMLDTERDDLHCCEFWSREHETAAFEGVSRVRRMARGEGLPGRVWNSRQPEWITDIATDGGFPRVREALGADLHAAFAFPVTAGGDLLGVVEFFSRRVAEPDEGLLKMMETVGSLLGQFVARRRAEAALFEEKERAQVTLNSIGDGVIVTDTAGRVTYLNPAASVLTGWYLMQAEGKPVTDVFRLVAHSSGAPLPCPLTLAIQGNRRVGLGIDTELVRRDGARRAVEDAAAPVHDRAGEVVGGVVVFHDVSESRAMHMKMSHLTRHDHLTGLPNRALLHERLAHAIGQARDRHGELALLYIDLDGFKHINDSLGHEVGDLLLQEVTQRLLDSVRSVDTVSRQGGDEFTVLQPEIRSSSDAVRVAEHILQAVGQPFHIGDAELNLTASVGIALYPADGAEAGVLLKHADAAMHRAKLSGRNHYHFFTREISERADRRLAIESALHQALRNDELVLHYQPKVAPSTGALTGMEALVRWQQPGGRLVMPGEFIEVAEDSGLIGRIDRWVLETACRQNRAWQDAGLPAVPVAVNLSAANAQIEQFPAYLASVLRRTGLAPGYLQIELTESQMLHDTELFETLIRGINALGVKVAIDDFGTGYSSLGYLQRFPFDAIKIDQSFVRALKESNTESAIVDAITRLARAFNFSVVAEGVETREQAHILQGYGCDEMQGYLYSRPVPADQLEALLRRDMEAARS
ncbi:EAL domain-containing protein [Massilia sp. AB1]|uniref:EAL domain-containing protein n=1 Tax=Massilia sp. AB1 TaxID=2823371 RepID=UPI001B81589E|nr:EAL domain-containing protein [Massilia sp. AB1]MBQ5941495.1 EAL domain-containing protein [Massilia sp. AB1]